MNKIFGAVVISLITLSSQAALAEVIYFQCQFAPPKTVMLSKSSSPGEFRWHSVIANRVVKPDIVGNCLQSQEFVITHCDRPVEDNGRVLPCNRDLIGTYIIEQRD